MGELSGDAIRAPERLSSDHDLSAFESGSPVLDDWLRRRALRNQERGGARTYVVCTGKRVVGYYALAAGAIAQAEATSRARRNMPDPVPVMVLGRLAIDAGFQGRGLGRALLRDAILRTMQAADIVGIRAILVHAISEDAKRFYERCGFQASPLDDMTLMITLPDAEKALGGAYT
ncbi:MAG: GNAT family N-acetyltransferase [Hyphomicrobiales bacterium]